MQNNVSIDTTEESLAFIEADAEEEQFLFTPKQLIQILTTLFVPLAFGLIVLVGIFGNALVIIVVATNVQMRSTTNLLILNLAVADLLFIILCVPFTATDYVLNSWPFGLVWCQTVQYLIYFTSYVSIYTLILMSIDRFIAVVYPVASMEFRTIRNATLAIFVLWTIIGVTTIPVWMSHKLVFKQEKLNISKESNYGHGYDMSNDSFSKLALKVISSQKEEDEEEKTEVISWCRFDSEGYSESGFYVAFFVSSYAIPLVLIVFLYIGMLRRLWNPGSIGNKISKESLRNKRRVTRLVLVVIVVFSVCWAPIQFVLLLKAKGLYQTKTEADYPRIIFQIFAHVLAYVNSCVNPILYAFLSDNFRKAFHVLMPCFMKFTGPTHPGHHALRYELTTMKSSTRSREERRRRPNKQRRKAAAAAAAAAAASQASVATVGGLNEEVEIRDPDPSAQEGHQESLKSCMVMSNSLELALRIPDQERPRDFIKESTAFAALIVSQRMDNEAKSDTIDHASPSGPERLLCTSL